LVAQITTAVGLTVLAEAGIGTRDVLRDLGAIDPGDELLAKDILANVA